MLRRTTHIIKIALLLMVAGLLAACEQVLIDERGDDLRLYDYYIDEDGNEGIVVEKDSDAIVVLSLDEVELSWGPMDEAVFKETDKHFFATKGFSVAMQYAMLNKGIHKFPAQAWCYAKNKEEQISIGSWRLPSLYDWQYLVDVEYHWDDINEALIKMGGVPLSTDDHYWTSTEDYQEAFSFSDEDNDYDAANRAVNITIDLRAFTRKDRWTKNTEYKVRAIKHVYYKD